MAIIKEIKNPIKSSEAIYKAVDYVTNPNKIFRISYENCSGKTAEIAKEFYVTRTAFNQNQGILAHHYVQSFSPNENLSPEQAHEIARQLIKKVAPNYQVVFSTHMDKGNIHTHFLINSVNLETGYKWHGNKDTLKNFRKESDILCKQNNLDVIETHSAYKSLDQTTYQLAKKGFSWKVNLVKDLDEALEQCKSKIDFIDFLNKKDYSVKYTNSNITVQKNGEKKAIRLDTLAQQFGSKYSKNSIEKVLNIAPFLLKKSEQRIEKNKNKIAIGNEWERFCKYSFSKIQPLSNQPYIKKSKKLYLAEKAWKENQKNNQQVIGNIQYKKLTEIQGENFTVKVPPDLLPLLSNKPLFYSAYINSDSIASITIKEKDKEILSKILSIDLKLLEEQAEMINNKKAYKKIKTEAEKQNISISYMSITSDQLALLKNEHIPLSYFKKDNNINISFLASFKEKITSIVLSPEEIKRETEYQKNSRIYNELKVEAVKNNEKLKYKLITSEQFEKLKGNNITFAWFYKKDSDKYNIAFLLADEKKINEAVYEEKRKDDVQKK